MAVEWQCGGSGSAVAVAVRGRTAQRAGRRSGDSSPPGRAPPSPGRDGPRSARPRRGVSHQVARGSSCSCRLAPRPPAPDSAWVASSSPSAPLHSVQSSWAFSPRSASMNRGAGSRRSDRVGVPQDPAGAPYDRQCARRKPDERIEPVDSTGNVRHELRRAVVPFHVVELVEQHNPLPGGRPCVAHRRHQHHWPRPPPRHRHRRGTATQDPDRTGQPDPAGELGRQSRPLTVMWTFGAPPDTPRGRDAHTDSKEQDHHTGHPEPDEWRLPPQGGPPAGSVRLGDAGSAWVGDDDRRAGFVRHPQGIGPSDGPGRRRGQGVGSFDIRPARVGVGGNWGLEKRLRDPRIGRPGELQEPRRHRQTG